MSAATHRDILLQQREPSGPAERRVLKAMGEFTLACKSGRPVVALRPPLPEADLRIFGRNTQHFSLSHGEQEFVDFWADVSDHLEQAHTIPEPAPRATAAIPTEAAVFSPTRGCELLPMGDSKGAIKNRPVPSQALRGGRP